jgi:predicted transcriptional regulator
VPPKLPGFGDLECRVLESLWRRAVASSVRDVCADFPESAYTTLMTTLDRLFRKGVLERERVGRAFVYWPCFSREQLEARLAAHAVRAFLDHEPDAVRPALSFLVDAVGHDAGLLDELEALVRERRRREKGEKGEKP